MKGYLQFSTKSFVWTFILYLIVSAFIEMYTSSGWSGWFTLLFNLLIVVPFLTFTLITVFEKRKLRSFKYVFLNKNLFALTFIFQVLMYLFNSGDCGDEAGTTFFLHFIRTGSSECLQTIPPLYDYMTDFAGIFNLIYVILLLLLIFKMRKPL